MKKFIYIFLLLLFIFTGCIDLEDFSESDVNPQPYEEGTVTESVSTGETGVYFSDVYSGSPDLAEENPRSIDRILAGILDSSEISIDAALHELDSEIIAEALIRAHKRGVKVRLVTESDYYMEEPLQKVIKAGIPVVEDRRNAGLMHNKYIIIDGVSVWTGSFNTTDRCSYYNNNNAVIIKSRELAERYEKNFNQMFENHKFGPGREENDSSVINLPDGTSVRCYFSPEDGVGEKVIEEIYKAGDSIYFMAFSFTDDDTGAAVINKFQEGLDVKGIFEENQNNEKYSEYYPMKDAGIPVKEDSNKYNMHHKVMIIDKKTVITGSYNFSRNAEESNDENLLIIENPSLAGVYLQEFAKIYEGKTVDSPDINVKENNKGKININTATKEELESLPDIGPSLAELIIEGRPYKEKSDIMKVKGIGKGIYKKIEKLIYVK